MRLSDLWIMPMLFSAPRSLAIWARFFTDNHGPDSGEHESAFEKADDVWDSTSDTEFWFTFVFAPYYPHYRIANNFHVADSNFFTDYCDTVFYMWAALQLCVEPIAMLLYFKHGLKDGLQLFLKRQLEQLYSEAIRCVLCLLYYYFGWYIYSVAVFTLLGTFVVPTFLLIIIGAGAGAVVVSPKDVDVTVGIVLGFVSGFATGVVASCVCIVAGVSLRAILMENIFCMVIYVALPLQLYQRLWSLNDAFHEGLANASLTGDTAKLKRK